MNKENKAKTTTHHLSVSQSISVSVFFRFITVILLPLHWRTQSPPTRSVYSILVHPLSLFILPSYYFNASFHPCSPPLTSAHTLSVVLAPFTRLFLKSFSSQSHFILSCFPSVPAEWVAAAYSICPLGSPLFYCCQSTELTWAFGSAGDGWNFEEEAPANLAQNAAFPPNWNPTGWRCFSLELRPVRPKQPPCSAT